MARGSRQAMGRSVLALAVLIVLAAGAVHAATITVNSPNGGETWIMNSLQTIRWQFSGTIGPYVRIELYKWYYPVLTIATYAPAGAYGAGSYSWRVPVNLTYAYDYRIKVTSITYPTVTDYSDTYFIIATSAVPPSITVGSPNGGETWAPGSTNTIRWTYTGSPCSLLRIDLLKGGAFLTQIANDVPIGIGGSVSYPWKVPTTLPTGSDYRVRIGCSTGGSVYDVSNGNFGIGASATPTITVTSPTAGQTCQAGTQQTVRWTSTGSVGAYVRVDLFKGAALQQTIASGTNAAAGYCPWTVPATLSAGSDYSVRVSSVSYPAVSDSSDVFSITTSGPALPSITVNSPNGGETWQAGTRQAIRWTPKGSIGFYVRIHLYKGSVLKQAITSYAYANTGYYMWTIPATLPAGSDYKIRVTSYSSPSVYDSTDGFFTIRVGP